MTVQSTRVISCLGDMDGAVCRLFRAGLAATADQAVDDRPYQYESEHNNDHDDCGKAVLQLSNKDPVRKRSIIITERVLT